MPRPAPARAARVMVLVDTLAAGGAERVAVDIACGLDRSAFRPHVVATKRGGPLEERLAGAGIPCTILGRRRRTSVRPALRALDLARSSDLIHSHLFGNNVWGALLAGGARVPLLAHEHNRVGRHTRFEPVLDRHLIGRVAHRVLCVSESVARPLADAGVAADRIVIVPNGVSLDAALPRAAARRELGLPDDELVVGTVGSLRPEKGHDVLLRAFAALAAAPEAFPVPRLCVVGDGAQRGQLQELARGLALEQRVTWAGERRDAARLVSAFDVAVVPSRSEGLPLAALEAMAAETPLVATCVGSLPGLLAGGAGLLVEPDSSSALCGAIATLLADRRLAAGLAARARRRVAERHDLPAVVERIERIYDAALAARWARRGSA